MSHVLRELHRAIAIFTYYEVLMNARIGRIEEMTATEWERNNTSWPEARHASKVMGYSG